MRGARRWSAMGLVLGVLLGALLVGVGRTSSGPVATAARPSMRIDVLHRSPLLVMPGERPELVYELVCATADPGASCVAAGEIHVRAAGAPAFTRLPLERGRDGRLRADLAPSLYRRGFAYYAVVREAVTGAAATLPPGGAAAPHEVHAMTGAVDVDLGIHEFGRTRRPTRTVARAAWGSGAGRLGLDDGLEQSRVGPAAFDVAADGSVVVLDQHNRRLVTYSRSGRAVRSTPIPFEGGRGDLALAPNGTAVVVNDGGPGNPRPIVRLVSPEGRLVSSAPMAERTLGMVRWTPVGAAVQQTPSDTWIQATLGVRRVLDPSEQVGRGLAGRLVGLPGGTRAQLVVDGGTHEARYALVGAGRVLASWKVRSRTPMGEIQLAEPLGDGILVVQRLYTDRRAEFLVLRLAATGAVDAFAVDAVEWAETAAYGQFRLGPDGLYQMRSTPSGVRIVRFGLGR